jgi:hypothetical protein
VSSTADPLDLGLRTLNAIASHAELLSKAFLDTEGKSIGAHGILVMVPPHDFNQMIAAMPKDPRFWLPPFSLPSPKISWFLVGPAVVIPSERLKPSQMEIYSPIRRHTFAGVQNKVPCPPTCTFTVPHIHISPPLQ